MDLIETIFIGISRIFQFLGEVLNGLGSMDFGAVVPVLALLFVGGVIGVRNSERRRGRYEAKQAKDRSTEYRKKGF